MSAAELEAIEKRYGRLAALARVSLALAPRSFTLLSGPNGAGKSTLLRILAGLTRPTRGNVRLFGIDPFRSGSAANRARIGYLGADSALYGELTVAENLRFSARLRGIDPARSEPLIAELALAEVRDRRVCTLSQGFRRRAALARALLGDPELLLLDEPWNGLDPEAAGLLARGLARRRDAGTAVLVAAHGMPELMPLLDRTLHLDAGVLA